MIRNRQKIVLVTCLIVLIIRCSSTVVIEPQPHTFIAPPAGKSVVYFLLDWPEGSRDKVKCSGSPPSTQLNVEGMVFAELPTGSWTYLYIEPQPHNIFVSHRKVINTSANRLYGGCGSWLVGGYGNGEYLAQFDAKPNTAYYFAWDWSANKWTQISQEKARSYLDLRPEKCEACSGRPFNDYLQLVEPPKQHFLSPKRDKVMCLQKCYRENSRLSRSGQTTFCRKSCNHWFESTEK